MEVTHEQLDNFKNNIDQKIDLAVLRVNDSMKEQIADLKLGLATHVREDDERFKHVDLKFDTKVPYTVFTWVFGIAMLIIITLFGTIWGEIKQVTSINQDIK